MITSEPSVEPATPAVTVLHRASADEVAALAFDMRFPPPGAVPAPRVPVSVESTTAD